LPLLQRGSHSRLAEYVKTDSVADSSPYLTSESNSNQVDSSRLSVSSLKASSELLSVSNMRLSTDSRNSKPKRSIFWNNRKGSDIKEVDKSSRLSLVAPSTVSNNLMQRGSFISLVKALSPSHKSNRVSNENLSSTDLTENSRNLQLFDQNKGVLARKSLLNNMKSANDIKLESGRSSLDMSDGSADSPTKQLALPETPIGKKKERMGSRLVSQEIIASESLVTIPEVTLVICRVCEKKFPGDSLEAHSKVCAIYYAFNEKNHSCNHDLVKYKNMIKRMSEQRRMELQSKRAGIATFILTLEVYSV
jgi:hypothetical protein